MKKKSKLFINDTKTTAGHFSEKKQKNWKWWLKRIFWVCFFTGLAFGILLISWVLYIANQAPEVSEIEANSFSQSSTIFDKTGTVELYSLHGEENRELVSLDQVSDSMKKAILAAEDAGFYEHEGVSFTGIARAGLNTVRGRATGGSTISQQLVKQVVFAPKNETLKQKVERKIKEIAVTQKFEKKYSKDRILELYLNKSPFGRNTYGIESAAQSYFGKSAKDLSIAESAVLAGLPQAPSRYAAHKYSYTTLGEEELAQLQISSYEELINNEKYSIRFAKGIFGTEFEFANGAKVYYPGRFDFVLGQMKEKNFITEEEYEAAKKEAEKLEIKPQRTDIKAPHFEAFVEEQAHKILKEIYHDEYDEKILNISGLKIYTSLDYDLQIEVERILSEKGANNFEYQIKNGAALVMNPQTGEILAMAGSRDFYGNYIDPETGETLTSTEEKMKKKFPNLQGEKLQEAVDALKFDGQVNILTSKRQSASTFKPIVYASAFENKGLSPSHMLMEVKTHFSEYIPDRFKKDEKLLGPVSIRKALGKSLNIPAVKAGIISGIPNLVTFAQNMGITFDKDADFYGAPISLGSAEILPLEMGSAYSSFANGGKKVSPVAITKIVNSSGDIIYEYNRESKKQKQIFSEETAYLISDILSDSSGDARPKGWNRNLMIKGHTIAAKTGTSTVFIDDKKIQTRPHDAWVVGYSPQIMTLVWTGNNKGWKQNPKGALSNSASGLRNAGPIFKEIMTVAHANLESQKFTRPSGIINVKVSKISGLLPPEGFPEELIKDEVFNTSYLPTKEDNALEIIRLVASSKLLPNEFTPEKAIEEFIFLNFHSYFPEKKNWEDPVTEWMEENREEFTNTLLKEVLENNEENNDSFIDISHIITSIPTEITTEFTAETQRNAPSISIISPANMGVVTPPSLNIEVKPVSQNRIISVEFYWNDELITTKRNAPWKTTLDIGENMQGTTHTITTRVTDSSFYSGENSVQVKIGNDTVPPEIISLFPGDGDQFNAHSSLQVSLDAIDRNSSIQNVDFFIDNTKVKTLNNMPFEFRWNVPSRGGEYSIRAVASDQSGNTSEKTNTFFVSETSSTEVIRKDSGEEVNSLSILSPSPNSTQSSLVKISFFVPQKLRNASNEITVNAKKDASKRQEIFTIAGDQVSTGGEVSFSHLFEEKGSYQLYLKTKSQSPIASQKIYITVE